MFTQIFPIISTPDVPRSLRFYRDLLGGTASFQFSGPDGEPVYVGIELGSSHLGIGLEPQRAPPRGVRAISLWVYADDCDAAIERLREAGVPIVEEPVDQPWGERVARVRDPDGNEVIIGARASSDGAAAYAVRTRSPSSRFYRSSMVMSWAPSQSTRRPISESCSRPSMMVPKWLPASCPSLELKATPP